jgi:hypothetical protein
LTPLLFLDILLPTKHGKIRGQQIQRVPPIIQKKTIFVFIFFLFFHFLCVICQGDETLELTYLSKIQEPAWAMGSEANVFVSNDRLYISLGYPGLAVYDISNPESPQRILYMHSTDLGGQAGAIAASGDRVFVATPDRNSLAVLDISNLSNPIVSTRFGAIYSILQISLRGQKLYVHAGSSIQYYGGVYVFDVSKEVPELVGEYLTNLIDPGFYVNGQGIVFLARTPETLGDSAKVDVVDMNDPPNPVFLGRWESPFTGNIVDIDLRGNLLYCAAYWGGFWILDASDYSDINFVARHDWFEPESFARSAQGLPPFVFLAQGGSELSFQKFNVYRQDSDLITLEKEIPATTYTHSVYLHGNLLILIEKESSWETSNPQKILSLYQVPTSRPKPPLYPLLTREINRSLFRKEAFHTISWSPNPENDEFVITEYRVYRKYPEQADIDYKMIGSVSADVFEFVDGYLDFSERFVYAVTSVEESGFESEKTAPVESNIMRSESIQKKRQINLKSRINKK